MLQPRAGGPALPVGQDGYLAAELGPPARGRGRRGGRGARGGGRGVGARGRGHVRRELGAGRPAGHPAPGRAGADDQGERPAGVRGRGRRRRWPAVPRPRPRRCARSRRPADRDRQRLGDRPWGVGILGFAPAELRAAQLAAVVQARPAGAIIAGGRPSPGRGARGGRDRHVPARPVAAACSTSSSPRAPAGSSSRARVRRPRRAPRQLPACGRRRSLRPCSTSCDARAGDAEHRRAVRRRHPRRAVGRHGRRAGRPAGRARRGVGVLMGTGLPASPRRRWRSGRDPARCSSSRPAGQRHAPLLETAPGHCHPLRGQPVRRRRSTRSRAELRGDGPARPGDLGTARAAQPRPAADRQQGPAPRRTDRAGRGGRGRSCAEGMFMIGQVAALRDGDHHDRRSCTGRSPRARPSLLRRPRAPGAAGAGRLRRRRRRRSTSPSSAWPGCSPAPRTLAEFWANIAGRRRRGHRGARRPLGPGRVLLTPEPAAAASGVRRPSGAASCRRVPFDPLRYGIPPASWPAIEPVQLLALEVARRALADAGYADAARSTGRAPSVVFGAEAGTDLSNAYGSAPAAAATSASCPPSWTTQLPELTEDTFPGVLANVIAGRIANRLDLGGVNYTVDAACASSLAALDAGLQGAGDRHQRHGAVRRRRPAQRHLRLPAVRRGPRAVADRPVPAVRRRRRRHRARRGRRRASCSSGSPTPSATATGSTR